MIILLATVVISSTMGILMLESLAEFFSKKRRNNKNTIENGELE